ncbi:MAG: DUF2490 domain-containing protein, partial [Crocinitomicaceae bacterium]|nr:DUF2490 domain-containing protein [Crocinitomicaceae bacterium]
MKYIVLIISFLFLYKTSYSQKSIHNQQHAWITYQGNHKLSQKWGLHTEYQWRRSDYFQDWQQSLARIGLDYHFQPNAFLSAGYGNIITFQYGSLPVNHSFNEHRIWEQFTQTSTVGRVAIQHRYRLEQRFLESYVKLGSEFVRSSTLFRNRIRYRALAYIPINKPTMTDNTLFININDEVFLGFGQGIGTNILDQNRFQTAIGWKFDSKCMIQIGYLNQYVVKNAKAIQKDIVLDQAENNHTVTIG